MKKVIFMCAISSMILLPSCKRLLNKDSKNSTKEVSKDSGDGMDSKKEGAENNDPMDNPATPNSQGMDSKSMMDNTKKKDDSNYQMNQGADPNTMDGQTKFNDGPTEGSDM